MPPATSQDYITNSLSDNDPLQLPPPPECGHEPARCRLTSPAPPTEQRALLNRNATVTPFPLKPRHNIAAPL